MISIPNTIYFPNTLNYSLKHDKISNFINSLNIVPHDFGHQFNSCNISTNGYRLIGDFEIIYFVDGKSFVKVGSREYICEKGDFILIPPFIKNSIKTSVKEPHNNYWIHFDILPLSMSIKFSSIFSESETFLFHFYKDKSLNNIYKKLEVEYFNQKKGSSIVLKASILLILIELFNNIETENIYIPDMNLNNHSLTEKIVNYIKNNIENVSSVSFLCKKFNISKTHLNNIFKTNIGITPGKLIQYQKLKNAEILLFTTSLTIEEISYKLSYSSPAYFNNLFKKYYGISPGKYRKSYV